MTTTRFTEALNEHVVLGIEKHDFTIDTMVAQSFDHGRQLIEFGARAARVDADRRQLAGCGRMRRDVAYQGVEQRYRQVVDAVETGIFEHMQSDALARSGQTGNQDYARGFVVAADLGHAGVWAFGRISSLNLEV